MVVDVVPENGMPEFIPPLAAKCPYSGLRMLFFPGGPCPIP